MEPMEAAVGSTLDYIPTNRSVADNKTWKYFIIPSSQSARPVLSMLFRVLNGRLRTLPPTPSLLGQSGRRSIIVNLKRSSLALCLSVVSACMVQAPSSDGIPTRTEHPPAAGATAIDLPVQPVATPLPQGVISACPASLFVPVRISFDGTRVSFVSPTTGRELRLRWPRGFRAWSLGGVVEIIAPDGSVIGRTGDILTRLGGADLDICSVNDVYFGPAA